MKFILQPQMSWQLFVLILAGWINHREQEVIEYLRTENRVLLLDLSDQRREARQTSDRFQCIALEPGTIFPARSHEHSLLDHRQGNALSLQVSCVTIPRRRRTCRFRSPGTKSMYAPTPRMLSAPAIRGNRQNVGRASSRPRSRRSCGQTGFSRRSHCRSPGLRVPRGCTGWNKLEFLAGKRVNY